MVVNSHWQWYHWKLRNGFLFAFHSNYGSASYRFRDKARYWPKIAISFIPPAFDAPASEVPVTVLMYRWCGDTIMVWLLDGEKSLMRCLAVSMEYRRVTVWRTDRQTVKQDSAMRLSNKRASTLSAIIQGFFKEMLELHKPSSVPFPFLPPPFPPFPLPSPSIPLPFHPRPFPLPSPPPSSPFPFPPLRSPSPLFHSP